MKNNKTKKSHKICNKFISCSHVPCNRSMNKCRPSYCVPGSSRNWTYCNMVNYKEQDLVLVKNHYQYMVD